VSGADANSLDLTGTGLEGVSLGRTEIALVDGQNGRLIYRGHDAERLAEERRF
jgi:citrate synthase